MLRIEIVLNSGVHVATETDQFPSIDRFWFEYNNSKQEGSEEMRIGKYQVKHEFIVAVGVEEV